MRVIFVTSSVTYVKDNYLSLFQKVFKRFKSNKDIEITALGLLQIPSQYILKNVFGLIVLGAPDVGLALFRNLISSKVNDPRVSLAEDYGIKVLKPENVNSPEARAEFASFKPDIIANIRTRNIYRDDILALPKIACINIHHGLLPDHRGTMCDLWAWSDGRPVGFTIHKMNAKIDDGSILFRREIPVKGVKSYVEIPQISSQFEADGLSLCLEKFVQNPAWKGFPNSKSSLPHTRNPNYAKIQELRKKGFRL
ncbi:MAG: hypothetical protein HQM08_22900 [Candidatus Riflebacteria bacterium]|nr:hypothetical protein [Candidatus Riflebacteria bacterium]